MAHRILGSGGKQLPHPRYYNRGEVLRLLLNNQVQAVGDPSSATQLPSTVVRRSSMAALSRGSTVSRLASS